MEKFIKKTTHIVNDNQSEIIEDLVHSGGFNVYDNFIPAFDKTDEIVKKFIKGVVDDRGKSRQNDSEFKYIYHFIKNYMNTSDKFIIETKNIYYACNSCQRELLILKEFLKN
ncbi:hypothetical protein ACSIGC_11225 [Tenacibaculum sp. ZS6-P6]|uniref:hypothetical protein n=1 Tax=Tenacibaculum sp. ZS6-P6 TaxID=3447503 RepID=UPI003F9912BB